MEFTIGQIALMLNGYVEGTSEAKVHNIAPIEQAQAGDISFLANMKYEPAIYSTGATAVLVSQSFEAKNPVQTTLIRVADPYLAFTSLLEQYEKLLIHNYEGIEQPSFIADQVSLSDEHTYVGAFAYIGSGSRIEAGVKIFPHVYIGKNVKIGKNSVIYAGVRIYDNTEIGQNCTIQAGAVLGSQGFGFAPQADGSFKAIPQLGKVVLSDNVDIGANTVIDRATMGQTLIGKGVKLDNLIQVAHNVEIGANTVIAAQTGISGSSKIGERCMIGGQVGLVGHITIANKTQISAQSGMTKNIKKENTAWHGSPAFELTQFLKSSVIFRKLPQLVKQIEEIEQKIIHLPNKNENGSQNKE